ncbi:MAG: SpoIIE family protein phosphatase, partial [Phycisphaerae bacterium]|nr:SpoIIE family protein phosphatase [Phycisphaerae bacterium]
VGVMGPKSPDMTGPLAAMIDVTRDLGTTFNLTELLERVAAAAQRTLGCDRASVFLYDAAVDELYSQVATGVEQLRFSAKSGIAGQAVQTRTAILVPDAYADPRFNRAIDAKTGYRTHNMLTFPLVGHDGSVVGVLQVLNKIDGDFTTTDEMLADALSKLAGVAIERQMLLDEYREKCKLEHDLNVARVIQQSLLPAAGPQVPGYDIAGWNKPADETGGDCFDFWTMPDGGLAFLVADATGHGIGPALLVAACRSILRGVARLSDDLSVLTGHLNDLLCEDMPVGRFVTACFGILDPDGNTLACVGAGHGPQLHLRAASGTVEELPPTGPLFGVMPGAEFEEPAPVAIASGDLFVVLTDGFHEWLGADKTQYGMERVIETLSAHRDRPAAELIQHLYADVLRFAQGTPQQDDLTIVLIKRL